MCATREDQRSREVAHHHVQAEPESAGSRQEHYPTLYTIKYTPSYYALPSPAPRHRFFKPVDSSLKHDCSFARRRSKLQPLVSIDDNALLCRASYSSSSAPGENDEAKPKTPVAPAAAQQELHPSSPPSPSERAPSPPQSSSSADEQDVEQLLKSQLPSELGWLSGAGGAATSAARGQRKDAAQQGLGEQRAPADPAAAAEGGDVAARLGEGASGRAAAVQAAVKEGTLGFGFSAGGFLYCYHLGVLWELQRLGLLRDRVQMAGASAGSLAIATYNSGLDVTKATSALHEFAAECRSHGTRYRLSGLLKDFLHTYLPDDAHLRCEGVCHVALTRLFPYLQPESVSQFHSKDDLVEALLASCHIPVYASGSWVTKFRGRYYVDGGVANFVPAPPTPTAIKVCCFPVNQILNRVQPTVQNSARLSALLDVSISPDAFEAFPHSYQTMLTWALLPAEPEVLDSLITKGRRDALAWAQSMQLVEGQGLLQPATSTTLAEQHVGGAQLHDSLSTRRLDMSAPELFKAGGDCMLSA
eukprot:CAMPEP_0202891716 /NCGR_PEP_ID=MMETSP1392-20130828/1710_1 /ASSEMBLY_ACC=CAM_ASM_000868 /TAXON_ID=225041 /ORGANISM="Chlamydomonas chlamydogama, Strain SAG 11-48b" /LENGTH=529 /DNA_ID=CAMNT_0049575549 /DNA_START=201 /DNA_END=1792 /DNA_ORIENTATION=+